MAKSKGTGENPLKMAKTLTEQVKKAWSDGSFYEKVSPITQDLLRYWFFPAFCDIRDINFHEGQKQAILNIIYLHEVLGVKNVKDLYLGTDNAEILQNFDIDDLNQDKYQHPMYAVKMATGTGKTWVMHALLIWQYLNASDYRNEKNFSKNFLVIAPGLIVYNRLLDAFLGKENEKGVRDFDTSDFKKFEKLFIPETYKNKVFGFIQSSVAKKEEISSKVTGDGLIAITNWHLLAVPNENNNVDNPLETPEKVLKNALPVSPSGSNELNSLDNNFLKGDEIQFLSGLNDLVVFNDEAHHLHRLKREKEKKWQESLNIISKSKKEKYIQIDFSATPYKATSGKSKIKHYFPHVIVEFNLKTAIHEGLVKMIAIDKRNEVASLKDLDFRAERDDQDNVIGLSKGQRLMLKAGYTKLQILEKDFIDYAKDKYPKMFITCEDTNVAPFVTEYFKNIGVSEEDILEIHSNKQGEVSEKEWDRIKQKLFNVDKYSSPKIIISVLMLKEGFDVNNICVIVPLRSTDSPILLEQTIGRGLRLMWRGADYDDIKAESRHRLLVEKREPINYLDLLSIVEHPKFIEFYEELDGVVQDSGDMTTKRPLGDMITVGLKDNFEDYDFYWPIIIQESEEILNSNKLSIDNLEPYSIPLSELQQIKGKGGEMFKSQEITVRTNFGEYRVTEDIFTANNYNEFLSKIISNSTSMFQNIGRKNKAFPMMQINQSELMGLIDNYIKNKLFNEPFNPMEDENWRILIMSENSIINHIIKQISKCMYDIHTNVDISEAIIEKIKFSTINQLHMRENYSMQVTKCIYDRLSYPSHGGGLEKAFIESLDLDGEVEAFTKINEYYHTFATITYIREDGLLARYYPDFIVKISDTIYVVETKAQKDLNSPNVQRKRVATLDMLDKINQLSPENRMHCEWKYVLLGENTFTTQSINRASIKDILEYSIVSEQMAKGYSTLDDY